MFGKKELLALCSVLIATSGNAATLPTDFMGNWETFKITKDYIDAGPWNCKFTSIAPGETTSPITIIVNMTCDMRRGLSWKTREVWSIQKIGDREVLIRADSKSIKVDFRRED
jgi:hypothetical protein